MPDQILLTGWSYGGYLTLLGLGRQPDLWAGGMAGVAIADWEMNYEDSSDLLAGLPADAVRRRARRARRRDANRARR